MALEADGIDRDHWHTWLNRELGMVALCPLSSTNSFQHSVNVHGIQNAFVLVRPDGCIGTITNNAAAIDDRLNAMSLSVESADSSDEFPRCAPFTAQQQTIMVHNVVKGPAV